MKSKPNLAGISIEDGVKASGMEEVIEGYKQALVGVSLSLCYYSTGFSIL